MNCLHFLLHLKKEFFEKTLFSTNFTAPSVPKDVEFYGSKISGLVEFCAPFGSVPPPNTSYQDAIKLTRFPTEQVLHESFMITTIQTLL